MSIRPVDLQIMVQKTPDAAKTNNVENQRPEIAQQTATDRFVKETLLNDERVVQPERSESEALNKDGKSGAEYRRERNKRRREKNVQASEAKEKTGFDISI